MAIELVLAGGRERWGGLCAVRNPDVDTKHPLRIEVADGVLFGFDIEGIPEQNDGRHAEGRGEDARSRLIVESSNTKGSHYIEGGFGFHGIWGILIQWVNKLDIDKIRPFL